VDTGASAWRSTCALYHTRLDGYVAIVVCAMYASEAPDDIPHNTESLSGPRDYHMLAGARSPNSPTKRGNVRHVPLGNNAADGRPKALETPSTTAVAECSQAVIARRLGGFNPGTHPPARPGVHSEQHACQHPQGRLMQPLPASQHFSGHGRAVPATVEPHTRQQTMAQGAYRGRYRDGIAWAPACMGQLSGARWGIQGRQTNMYRQNTGSMYGRGDGQRQHVQQRAACMVARQRARAAYGAGSGMWRGSGGICTGTTIHVQPLPSCRSWCYCRGGMQRHG
jgi:hypothetical protein